MSEQKQTVAEIAREAWAEVAVGLKTGAALPLRNAMGLLSKLEAGDYEKGDDEVEPKSRKKAKKRKRRS